MNHVGGQARIGNRRSMCTTCNNFAQNVMRMTRRMLAEMFPEEYARIRLETEVRLYRQVMEDFDQKYPASYPAPYRRPEEPVPDTGTGT